MEPERLSRGLGGATAALALAALAAAQSVNVSFNSGPPTDAYGAAAAQPGRWNRIETIGPSTWTLVDLAGAPTSVTVSVSPPILDATATDNPDTTGDDGALMDGFADLGSVGGSFQFTFANLANGHYRVVTYAWAPDIPTFLTRVATLCSGDPEQVVGGAAWPGGHVLGTTYAVHAVEVTGGTLVVRAEPQSGLGSLNGFQLVRVPEVGTPYCAGDGTLAACPCGNQGVAGRGCDNAQSTGGAVLQAFGTASVGADALTLAAAHLPTPTAALFFQTDASATPAVLGDGLVCAGGTLVRLKTLFAQCGQLSIPRPGDLPLSVLGGLPPQGGTRYYQAYYRNPPLFCTPATFNLTSGTCVVWTP